MERKRPRRGPSPLSVTGKLEPGGRDEVYSLAMRSYAESRAARHIHNTLWEPCQTWGKNRVPGQPIHEKRGISALDFDSTGNRLASVTKAGCLAVHDFESLCSNADNAVVVADGEDANESAIILHINLQSELDAVRWEGSQVACGSMGCGDVKIFDIGSASPKDSVQVFQAKQNASSSGGITDIAFSRSADLSVFASYTLGTVNIWDRRIGESPSLELRNRTRCPLNSILVDSDKNIVFGAGDHGIIYKWDIRGGSGSSSGQVHREGSYSPETSWDLLPMLKRILPSEPRKNINGRDIHSINLSPRDSSQLAFHLDNGWSGVFYTQSLEVTHVHYTRPQFYLPRPIELAIDSYLRKPSWQPTYPIYAVGSPFTNGIHLLDFYSNNTSPCWVHDRDNDQAQQGFTRGNTRVLLDRFIPLDEYQDEHVMATAAHPSNNKIVAGTLGATLVVISHGNLG